MRKRRIFLGLLLVVVLMAFAACSNKGTSLDPDTNTPNPVTDNNGTVNDNGVVDKAGNDVEKAVDDTGDAARDLVTSDGALNDDGTVKNNNL